MKDKFDEALENARETIAPQKNSEIHSQSLNLEETVDDPVPGVATPDQTRTDGMIPDPGLSHADTAGLVEDRKRKGNLEGM